MSIFDRERYSIILIDEGESAMNKKEKVINIMSMFKQILKKWRIMLIFALIVAVIVVAYKAVSSKEKAAGTAEPQNDKKYINYEDELNSIDTAIYNKNVYLENSILAKIDPTKVATAIVTINVTTADMKNSDEQAEVILEESTDYQNSNAFLMNPELRNANRILNYYLNLFNYGMDWGVVPEKLQTEPRYLNELVSVASLNEELVTADLRIIYINEEGAETLINRVQEVLSASFEEATDIYGTHTLEFSNQLIKTQAETRFFTWMNDRLVELNNLSTQRNNFTTNMKSFASSEIDSSPAAVSNGSIIKNSVKFGIIGLIVGTLIYIFLYAIWLILSNKVLSARDLNEQYNFNKLAVIPDGAKCKGIDAIIKKIDHDYYNSDDPAVSWLVANENICNAGNIGNTVAIIGDLQREELAKVKESLENALKKNKNERKIVYRYLPKLNENPKALEELEKCDEVVLVAKVMKSNYNRVQSLIETTRTYNKKIMGTIILD